MQSNNKNTFRTKEGGISSKIIANSGVVNLYMVTQGGQIPKYDPKYWYYANNFPFDNGK